MTDFQKLNKISLSSLSTGMGQKENRFPKTVCHQTRNLHGLVTAPKPTKTTKTLLADGQPMTDRGLDCDIQSFAAKDTFFFSVWSTGTGLIFWLQISLLLSLPSHQLTST